MLLVVLLITGCDRSHFIRTRPTIEENASDASQPLTPGPLQAAASTVPMSDAALAPQLRSGFYDVEQGAWRWTAGTFSVALAPPSHSAVNGGTLKLDFNVPDPLLTRVKQTTLTAQAGAIALPPQTLTKPGMQSYTASIPASALTTNPLIVTFHLDKFIPAGAIETRELGLIVTRVALESK